MPNKDPEKAKTWRKSWNAANAVKIRAQADAWIAANPGKVKAHKTTYLAKNPVKAKTSRATYYAKHRKESAARTATWKEAHPVEASAYAKAASKKWKAAHKIETKEKNAEWKKSHPAECRAHGRRHNALKRGAVLSDFTAAQWKTMQAAYDHRCVYCNKRAKGHLTQDHITPLSKGGNHTLLNVVPACRSCNSKKRTNLAPLPIQPLML